jgi:hypothetical protein
MTRLGCRVVWRGVWTVALFLGLWLRWYGVLR